MLGQTVAQHQANIGSMPRVCWVGCSRLTCYKFCGGVEYYYPSMIGIICFLIVMSMVPPISDYVHTTASAVTMVEL